MHKGFEYSVNFDVKIIVRSHYQFLSAFETQFCCLLEHFLKYFLAIVFTVENFRFIPKPFKLFSCLILPCNELVQSVMLYYD